MVSMVRLLNEMNGGVYMRKIQTWELDAGGVGEGWGIFASKNLAKGTKIPNLTGSLIEIPEQWLRQVRNLFFRAVLH